MQKRIDSAINSLLYVHKRSVNKKQKELLAKTIRELQLLAESHGLQTYEIKEI